LIEFVPIFAVKIGFFFVIGPVFTISKYENDASVRNKNDV
jgi:hypothetical protein